MTNRTVLSILAACGAAMAADAARAGTPAPPYMINLSGATLLKNFLKSPASTNDFVDVDNDGVVSGGGMPPDQLAPFDLTPPFVATQYWQLTDRFVGSVFGFQDFVDWGRTYAVGADGVEMAGSEAADDAIINRTNYVVAGVLQPIANTANPGAIPLRSLMDGSFQVTTSTDPTTAGILIDAAPIDTPSIWAVLNGSNTAAQWDRVPLTNGYGTNPRDSVTLAGAPAAFPSLLVNATAGNINFNIGSPDANTVFDTQLAFAPIAVIVNLGVGRQTITYTEIQHLNTTGRSRSGENLVWATRDIGSGTRNAFCNTSCTDPSFGVGENIGPRSNTSSQELLGANFRPSNKGGNSRQINTVINHRLGMGYGGAERGVVDGWLTAHRIEVMGVINDQAGSSIPVRPHIDNVLDNALLTGYNIGGPAVYGSFGDPRAEPAGFPGFGDNNGNPRMRNVHAAAYLNNLTRSVTAFKGAPGGTETEFTPGEYLAENLILLNARDFNTDPADPCSVTPNAALNTVLQEFARLDNDLANPAYLAFDPNARGVVPTRTLLSGGASYSDGVANGASYITESGTTVAYGQSMNVGATSTVAEPIRARNEISGDFDGNGLRDINDAEELVAAWRDRNGGPAWPGADGNVCFEIIGDFNGDGNFNGGDVRYWVNGLAMVTTVDGADPVLDRKQGYTRVDSAFTGNFFGTTLATPKTYVAGDSRGDIAGSGAHARGWAPIGQDGTVSGLDIDYVYSQFKNTNISDGVANWANLYEAVHVDLDADMDGDLDIDQCDVRELVVVVLGTQYGDADLNGVVDAADRTIVNNGISNPVTNPGWAGGDLNGDGAVTIADRALVHLVLCPGDIDGNNSVGFSDLNIVLSFFGSASCIPAASGDVDGDGDTDFGDLNIVLSFFGQNCS